MSKSFSKNLEQVFQKAKDYAQQCQHKAISPCHLLLGILTSPDCKGYQVLANNGAPIEKLISIITHTRFNYEPAGQPTGNYNARAKSCIENAQNFAVRTSSPVTRTEHLLFGLLADGQMQLEVYKPAGVQPDVIAPKLLQMYGLQEELAGHPGAKTETSEFAEYCISLNDLVRQGKIDPVIGRATEIQRVTQILGRRRKNNPVLLGEAGVGKTAVVEGLARSIVEKTCPPYLLDKEIFIFDLAALISNTVFRGTLEARMKMVLEYAKKNRNVILFIDEIHTIVGAGDSIGGMDVSNTFKPALARGEITCIGATTTSEYNKRIAKDAALERRFQPVTVLEPEDSDTLAILKGLLPGLEGHHNVRYEENAVAAALQLAKRYIPDRKLPDKAIDVLDEAGSAVKQAPSRILEEIEAQIITLNQQKLEAATQERFSEAQELLKQVTQLREHKNRLLQAQTQPRPVTEEDIRKSVSTMTGIPLENLTADDKKDALSIASDIGRGVIGQPEAVEAVARYLRRGRTRLNDPRRPIGTLLLLGPTGVGKTLIARRIATRMTGSEKGLIQLDMSEYMEKFSVSRLIGSPPGYIGYDDQNSLVEKVRRQPYAVVLFDEIEKAHPEVWNVLLQILEEGKLTDGEGRVASFRNTIVLLTSNVGAETLKQRSIGFTSLKTSAEAEAAAKERMLAEVKKAFRPEFLNRLDEIIVFNSLSRDDCRQILNLEVEEVRKRTNYTHFSFSDEMFAKMLKEGFNDEFGARPIRRIVERMVVDVISDALLQEQIKETGELVFELKEDKVRVYSPVTDAVVLPPAPTPKPPAAVMNP